MLGLFRAHLLATCFRAVWLPLLRSPVNAGPSRMYLLGTNCFCAVRLPLLRPPVNISAIPPEPTLISMLTANEKRVWDTKYEPWNVKLRCVALKKAVWLPIEALKLALLGFCVPIGCLWAWWWPSWRGWRTSWCLRKDQPSMPRRLPEGQRQQCSGIASRSWNLERFLEPNAGMAVFGWAIQSISGIFGFLEERRYLDGIGEVSSLLQWRGRSFGQPWSPTVFVELYLR